MGGNICKELGVVPYSTIDYHRFYSLWAAYDVEKIGSLSPSVAKKFLREFAEALGTNYNESLADQIISRCSKNGKLGYENFKTLFVEAIRTDERAKSRVKLTHSLAQMLPSLIVEWDNLPEEVLFEIFSYLGSSSMCNSRNVSLVSKRWRAVSMSVVSAFRVVPCSCSSRKSFDDTLDYLNHSLPRLKHLVVTESLWLSNRHIKALPKSLRTIDLSHCQNITNKSLRLLAQRCPNITSYSLGFCYGLSFPGLIHISSKTEYLNLPGWTVALAEKPWYEYLPKELTYLNLSHSDITNEALEDAEGYWPPNLRTIVLRNCPGVTGRSVIPPHIHVVRYRVTEECCVGE